MRILEIVLDGFKSYASRTVISDFDEHFNAITGFNGSGKSNILDAICFVLGISSMSTVRVTTKQEFIYKNGQAGISKANVTIMFDNSDKTRCHEAYKKFDTISVRREYSVGGNTKCTINGTTVTNEKVLAMFSMSGLNVNNANFLIMQGRITQVINMKPSEILSLVEETAGTNAYEEIRKKTVRTVEKKDMKLSDIENVISTEVMPILDQLTKENEEYLKYREICEQFESLEKKVKAAYYYEIKDMVINAEIVQQNYKDVLKELEIKEKTCRQQIKQLEKQKEEYINQADSEVLEKDKIKIEEIKNNKLAIEQGLDTMFKEVSGWDNKILEMNGELDSLYFSTNRGNAELAKYKEDLARAKGQLEENKQNKESLEMKLATLERGGMIDEDFVKNRRDDLKRKLEVIEESRSLNIANLSTLEKRREQKKKELENASISENFDFDALNKEISALEKSLKGFSELENKKTQLEVRKNDIEQEINSIHRSMGQFDPNRFACSYSLPDPGFDQSKVKGRLISLFRAEEDKFLVALEAGAAARLFSVVVDTDVTGQLLISKKCFGNVSILPNNKTQGVVCPNDIKQRIKSTFPKKAHLALDLIKFSPENKGPMELVFGNFFICETKEIAEKIAYDPSFRRRAVTLDGDAYNPDGTMSGGQSNNRSTQLVQYYEYKKFEDKKREQMRNLEDVKKELEKVRGMNEKFLNTKNDLDMKKWMKDSKEKSRQQSSVLKLETEIKEIDHGIEMNKEDSEKIKKDILEVQKEIKGLEKQKTNDPKEVLRETLRKAEIDVKKSSDLFKNTQRKINEIESRLESENHEICEKKELINETSKKIFDHKENIKVSKEQISGISKDLKKLQYEFDNNLHNLMMYKEQASEISQNLEKYRKDLESITKESGNIKYKRENMDKEVKEYLNKLEDLEKHHPYIPQMESEIKDFDKAQGKEKLDYLHNEKDKLGKRVNKKVSSTLDDHIKKYDSLQTKKQIVMQDKGKLLEIIEDLDNKKRICIEETWQKVDKNLREIYSMLLPGASAKLDAVDELTGLEMRVAFNNDWKNNLGELSGGQRSLLALSFILALLKVNPAPIYILDEIDAALDMSHTQNIGMMLRTHFAQSQFIVVSLKEGMFTNANVLFRTQFSEGRSIVERYGGNQNRK